MPTHNRFFTTPDGKMHPLGLTLVGPVVQIEIHVPLPLAEAIVREGKIVPQPIVGYGLIDTGATMVCVHEPVLKQLGLTPIAQVNSGTANGPAKQNVYPARIACPEQGWDLSLNGIAGVNLEGQTVLLNPPQPIIALLGRNILEKALLIYNGPGGFWSISL